MKKFPKSVMSGTICLLLLSSATAAEKDKWVKSGSDYHYDQSEFVSFSYNSKEGSLNSYTLSPGGAPDGWSYVEEETRASAGGLSVSPDSSEATGTGGVKKLKLSGAASATAWIADDEAPTSFSISMGGKLTKSGEEPGSRPSWSANANSKFFWLTPYQEQIIGVTEALTKAKVSANGDDNKAKWSVGSTNITEAHGKTSIEIIFEKAGSYTVSAEALENSSRSDSTTLRLVEFKEPRKNGIKEKFNAYYRYDNQAVRSSVKPNYEVMIALEAAGRSDAEVIVKAGGAGGTVSGNKKYNSPNKTGSDTIQLRFKDKGEEVYNERSIDIFEDHLARDRQNFGSNRSCHDGWKAISQYGVTTADLPANGQWNCHGSVMHAGENSGTGISNTTVSWPTIASKAKPDSSWWSSLSLKRNDVVAYYKGTDEGTLELKHSNICLNGQTAWAANNEPVVLVESWLWYECAPKAYYDKASYLYVDYVKVMRK